MFHRWLPAAHSIFHLCIHCVNYQGNPLTALIYSPARVSSLSQNFCHNWHLPLFLQGKGQHRGEIQGDQQCWIKPGAQTLRGCGKDQEMLWVTGGTESWVPAGAWGTQGAGGEQRNLGCLQTASWEGMLQNVKFSEGGCTLMFDLGVISSLID